MWGLRTKSDELLVDREELVMLLEEVIESYKEGKDIQTVIEESETYLQYLKEKE